MKDSSGKTIPSAATVIMLRDAAAGLEVFLMRRHLNQSFMGGAHVFPGGRVDPGDGDPALERALYGPGGVPPGNSFQESFWEEGNPQTILLAAIRETFEEAGVLFGRDGMGEVFVPGDRVLKEKLETLRAELNNGVVTLGGIAALLDIRFDPGMLVPYARWITPEIEKKRFDTRFFLAALPEGLEPAHDNRELTESRWIAPGEALKKHGRGEMLLMPPTLKTIEEIGNFSHVSALLDCARKRTIYPILPQAFMRDDCFGVLLPHDPEYAITGHGQPARPAETSRIVMRNGIWTTVPAP
ncbi:MAG TPA: hypothetical protein VLM75_07665 [Spirochaetota bacterium]|nr:hypothetical protein [Spirochaetota bacterium]